MNFNQESQLPEIIARKFGSGITDREQSVLDRWLAESEQHQELYERIMSGETIREREKLLSILDADVTIAGIDRKLRRRHSRRIAVWAGSAAAVMLFGVLYFFGGQDTAIDIIHEGHAPLISFNDGKKISLDNTDTGTEWEKYLQEARDSLVRGADPDANPIMITIEIPRGGEIYKLKLADGSTVWLNSETTIEYPERFGEAQRSVRLTSGEAFFEVAKDPQKPFSVQTIENVAVRVTGTSFNITAFREEGMVATILVTGSVEIATPHGSAGLTPGQKAVITHGMDDITVTEVNASRANLWTTGIFDFEAIPLADICARLSRWYDVDFMFEGGIDSERFSGRVRIDDPLQSFLDNIATVTDVTFKEKQGRIIVKPK